MSSLLPPKGCSSSQANPHRDPFPIAGDSIGLGFWTTGPAVMFPAACAATLELPEFPSWPRGCWRDAVTAQTSVPTFADALSFALALRGCRFGPAPRAVGTALAVACQEPQPVPTAGVAPLQGAALAAARANGSDDLGTDPVSFPWLPRTP